MGALAEELGLDAAAVLRLCRDRGIRASWDGSELSEESENAIRAALATPVGDDGELRAPVGARPGPPFPAAPDPAPTTLPPTRPQPGVEPAASPAAAGPVDQAAAWSGAPLDPRQAAVADGAATLVGASLPRRKLVSRTSEVASGVKTLLFGGVAFAGWAALHAAPDWDLGRWWLGGVALAALAALAGLRCILLGVRGFSLVVASPGSRRGRPELTLITVAAGVLLVATALLAAYDYRAIDIPDAYERLREATLDADETTDRVLSGSAGGQTKVNPQGADIAQLAGGDCLAVSGSGALVDYVVNCLSVHRYEVIGFAQFGAGSYPTDVTELAVEAERRCVSAFLAYIGRSPGSSRYVLVATYPNAEQWKNDPRGVCLAESPLPERGSALGSNR